jgi:hypothetical protein
MFNFIDISFFIPVSGCVGRDPSVLLCPGAYDTFKTALPTTKGQVSKCQHLLLSQTIFGFSSNQKFNMAARTNYVCSGQLLRNHTRLSIACLERSF